MEYSDLITLDNLNTLYKERVIPLEDKVGKLGVVYQVKGNKTWTEIKNLTSDTCEPGYVFNISDTSGDCPSQISVGSNLVCIKEIDTPITKDNWETYLDLLGMANINPASLDTYGLVKLGTTDKTNNRYGLQQDDNGSYVTVNGITESDQTFSGVKTFSDGINGSINGVNIVATEEGKIDGSCLDLPTQTVYIGNTFIEVGSESPVNNLDLLRLDNEGDGVIIEDNIVSGNDNAAFVTEGGIYAKKSIIGERVFNAVWNDIADCIEVDDNCELVYGKAYCFDGEKYYPSSKYLDDGIIGINSDTAGMIVGAKENKKQLVCAIGGFVLAYTDKDYKPGTPLTVGPNGILTEILMEDKIKYPEKIVATYWKQEYNVWWGSKDHKIKVNNRSWVKLN